VPYRDGLAYIGSSDLRRVSCIDPKDRRIVWRTDVFGAPWGRPVVTEKFVYAGAESIQPYMIRPVGGFCALDRPTGRLVWRWPLANPPGVLSYGFSAGPALVDDTLVIGEGAVVEAEIEIGNVIIQGTVVGNIKASGSIEIHAPGRVKGDLHTPTLQIDKGVIFEGRSFMEAANGGLKPPATAPRPPTPTPVK
jgi:outer membrane protein assembly factor BamB